MITIGTTIVSVSGKKYQVGAPYLHTTGTQPINLNEPLDPMKNTDVDRTTDGGVIVRIRSSGTLILITSDGADYTLTLVEE